MKEEECDGCARARRPIWQTGFLLYNTANRLYHCIVYLYSYLDGIRCSWIIRLFITTGDDGRTSHQNCHEPNVEKTNNVYFECDDYDCFAWQKAATTSWLSSEVSLSLLRVTGLFWRVHCFAITQCKHGRLLVRIEWLSTLKLLLILCFKKKERFLYTTPENWKIRKYTTVKFTFFYIRLFTVVFAYSQWIKIKLHDGMAWRYEFYFLLL